MGFSEDRAQGKFGAYYLLVAENPYVLWDATEHWKTIWHKAAVAGLRVKTFAAPQVDFDQLLGAGATVPMFETIQPVIMRDVEKFSGKKQEEFLRILRRSPESTKWLLTSENFDKRTAYYKALSGLGPVEIFPKIYPEHIPGWVQRIGSDLDATLAPAAVELIAVAHGADLFEARQTIERALLFAGRKRRLEVSDIETVIAGEGDYDVFQLLEAASRGDFRRALAISRSLSAGADPKDVLPLWLSLIHGQCLRYLRLLDYAGQSEFQITQEFRLPPFVIRKLRKQATDFGQKRLLRGIEDIFATDWAIKTSTMLAPLAWEILVWRLACAGPQSPTPLFDLENPRLRE